MILQACLNGARTTTEHPALPVTADDLAADVAAVAEAGAEAVHLHVKDDDGADTLAAEPLARVLQALRRPGSRSLPVGVTTGAWTEPDPLRRVADIRSWPVRPDFASVNWHEEGAEEVATALLEAGIGVEAGLWNGEAVGVWSRSPLRDRCLRVLLELPDGLDERQTHRLADDLLAGVTAAAGDRIPVLLHGEGSSTWPALRHAARRGLATRIGLEDTLVLPDGGVAAGNAALVATARGIIGEERLAPPEDAAIDARDD